MLVADDGVDIVVRIRRRTCVCVDSHRRLLRVHPVPIQGPEVSSIIGLLGVLKDVDVISDGPVAAVNSAAGIEKRGFGPLCECVLGKGG